MPLLDIKNFLLGLILAGIIIFFRGLLRAAGSDAWQWIKKTLFPPKNPIKVDGKFSPTRYDPGSCAWVRQEKINQYEQDGYFYYSHPKNGAKCYRETYSGSNKYTEWLMVKPDAKPVAT